jgi:hypothetical protein
MTNQWTIQIPVFITISGDIDQMDGNQDDILCKLKTNLERILFESGTTSARLEECVSEHEITLHEMDVVDATISTSTTY